MTEENKVPQVDQPDHPVTEPVKVEETPWPNQQEPLEGVEEVSQDPDLFAEEVTS